MLISNSLASTTSSNRTLIGQNTRDLIDGLLLERLSLAEIARLTCTGMPA